MTNTVNWQTEGGAFDVTTKHNPELQNFGNS